MESRKSFAAVTFLPIKDGDSDIEGDTLEERAYRRLSRLQIKIFKTINKFIKVIKIAALYINFIIIKRRLFNYENSKTFKINFEYSKRPRYYSKSNTAVDVKPRPSTIIDIGV